MFSRAIKSMFLLFIFVFSFVSVFASSYVDKWISYDENNIVQTILFEDFKILSGLGFEYTPEGLVLPIDGAVEISFDVPEDGLYLIVLHYMIDSDKVLTSRMSMFCDNNELLFLFLHYGPMKQRTIQQIDMETKWFQGKLW